MGNAVIEAKNEIIVHLMTTQIDRYRPI